MIAVYRIEVLRGGWSHPPERPVRDGIRRGRRDDDTDRIQRPAAAAKPHRDTAAGRRAAVRLPGRVRHAARPAAHARAMAADLSGLAGAVAGRDRAPPVRRERDLPAGGVPRTATA